MAMRLPPGAPGVNIGDDSDPLAEAGQKAQAALQQGTSLLSSYLYYRGLGGQGAEPPREPGGGDEAVAAAVSSRDLRREALEHPEGSEAVGGIEAGLVERGYVEITDPGRAAAKEQRLLGTVLRELRTSVGRPGLRLVRGAEQEPWVGSEGLAEAAEAADAAALWAQQDQDPASIVRTHGTNPAARSGARLRDAIGDRIEQLGADAAADDPLAQGLGDPLEWGAGDPLAVQAGAAPTPADDYGLDR